MGAQSEEVVSANLARRLIRSASPELRVATIELFGEGWDNTAYLVDDEWVFRFPRRSVAVELLEVECRILPELAPTVPLAVPIPVHLGAPCENFRWPFAGYRELPGRTACRANLSRDERERAAAPLAEFLAALHAFPTRRALELGVPGDTYRRMDIPYRSAQIRERFEKVRAGGLWAASALVEEIIAGVPTDWRPETGTLAHGDLYSRHVLVDPHGAPAGVIDWGDVHLGDAAVDLAVAHLFLPTSAHAEFRAAYGPIEEGVWRAARFRALFSALATLEYSHDIGDADLLRESHAALGYLKEC